MTKRVCLEPGCPTITTTTRCPTHTRDRDKARGTRQQRGYGADHDRLRAYHQYLMDSGVAYTCWRCGQPIDPTHWHLGHDDHDRTQYRGPEHVACNTATSPRRAGIPPDA